MYEHGQPRKIAIMGSGNIGTKLFEILRRQYPETNIVIENHESDRGTGTAISADQSEGISRRLRRSSTTHVTGNFDFTANMEDAMRDADIVVIAGGVGRKSPTQPRTDLAKDNIPYIESIAKVAGKLAKENPDRKTNYVIATNPIGLIDHYFHEASGIPSNQVIGLSGELDVERLRQSIRINLNVGYDDIRGERVIGDHGPNMVPVFSQIEVHKDGRWQKLTEMPEVMANNNALLDKFKEDTIAGGGKLGKWVGKTDFRGPAAALAYMVEQIVDARWGDKTASLPVTASSFVDGAEVYSGQTIKFNEDGTHSRAPTPPLAKNEQNDLDVSIRQARADKVKFNTLASWGKSTGTTDAPAFVD